MSIENAINRKSLSERLDGDFDLFKELAQLLITDLPKLLSAIEEAITSGNIEKIGKSAHTIKGAVSNFSADRAYQAALALEKIGKNNELEKADASFRELLKEIDSMKEALSQLIAENKF